MRRAAAALVLLQAAALAPLAGAELEETRFPSPSLGREVACVVHLPPSYRKTDRSFPVVYALHGLFEGPGFWERRGLAAILDDLWAKGGLPEFLVVAVDGDSSFFVNGPEGRYEDLVTRDVIDWAESHYRVVPARQGRALLGISMGGYAALRIALIHPQLFAAVAAHSAMLLLAPPTAEQGAGAWQMAAFHAAFGDPVDPARWGNNDPLALARNADPATAPRLHFDCGSEDRYGLYAGNRELDRRLTARGVAHEFALRRGDHGYEYVRSVLPLSLRFLAAALSPAEPARLRAAPR